MKPGKPPSKRLRSPRTRLARNLRDAAPAPRAFRQITSELSALWDKPTDGPDERPTEPEPDTPTPTTPERK